jgi:hypothetical protein
MIPRHPRSTSRLRCVCRGPLPRHARPPGLLLPRHAWHRSCLAHQEVCCTSLPRCVPARRLRHRQWAPCRLLRRPAGPCLGSHLSIQTVTSRTTTHAGLDHHLLRLHPPPRLLLPRTPWLLPRRLHQPPCCPRGRSLFLRWSTNTLWVRVRRAVIGCPQPIMSPLSSAEDLS